MKVIKVIVDEMPERCADCPLNPHEGWRNEDCGRFVRVFQQDADGGCRAKYPDSRCLCEVEGENKQIAEKKIAKKQIHDMMNTPPLGIVEGNIIGEWIEKDNKCSSDEGS